VWELNQARVLRAIPPSPSYDLKRITEALWVLESEEKMVQGTAFVLENVGLVTCQHVLASGMKAFQPKDVARQLPVSVIAQDEVIDLAIISVGEQLSGALPLGSADQLRQLDHLAVAGFPNYRLGDSGVIMPGLVVGFRPVSGIRRILTNSSIVAGNSGGPALDRSGRVVGVAATGADRMETAPRTENHGVVPIDALRFLVS
jgi:S1-C subfamily serine protease